MPTAPVPAKRSRKRLPMIRGRDIEQRLRMRAEIGRTGIAFGTDSSLRPGRTPFSFADIIE